jgi:hypothetical protein
LDLRRDKVKNLIRILTIAGYFVLAAVSQNAAAVVVIDFGTGLAGPGGTITESGGNVSGAGIKIGSMIVEGTTSSDGTYVVTGGILSFDTAADTISIVGDVLGIGFMPLLTGSFSSFTYNAIPAAGGGATEIFQADGPDTKSDYLLIELGVDLSTQFDFFGFSIESANGNVLSTDIINTAVPVPPAVWLFGSGLLGLVGIARRKKA